MSSLDPLPTTAPAKSAGQSLHGNDSQVAERRSLRDYYIILRERLWIALPVALLVALSFGYYKAQETPMYSSTASKIARSINVHITRRAVNALPSVCDSRPMPTIKPLRDRMTNPNSPL